MVEVVCYLYSARSSFPGVGGVVVIQKGRARARELEIVNHLYHRDHPSAAFHAAFDEIKLIMSPPENPSEPAQQQPRAPNGRFLPGRSANPGGRPAVVREVRSLARQFTEAAVMTLVSIAADRKAPAAARVSACAELLNRGHGRPEQPAAGAHIDAQDLPDSFTPSTAGEAVAIYEQLMAGFITADSAAAAMERASFAPAPTRQPEPPREQPTVAPEPCAAPAAPPVALEEPRAEAGTAAPALPPERREEQASAVPEREQTVAERYAQLREFQEDNPLPPPTGPTRIA